ncbi:MAG: DUF4395 domain-containing protein [Hydrogenophilales bacterium]|nr:DUF4395 domain-containing protein [Hydrogenophilales bacterium]
MTKQAASYVDHAEIKMGQILTMAISATALVLQKPMLLAVLGMIFLLSGTVRPLSPFSWLYRGVVQPSGIIKSDYRLDNIQPHKFGQLIGALTAVAALGLIQAGYEVAGWAVVVVLIALTLVSYAGWCIGCYLYYQLNRAGLRGFFKHTPTDKSVRLGIRPGRNRS